MESRQDAGMIIPTFCMISLKGSHQSTETEKLVFRNGKD